MLRAAKEVKYDRQLRLWSSEDQVALENARPRLCLINASSKRIDKVEFVAAIFGVFPLYPGI